MSEFKEPNANIGKVIADLEYQNWINEQKCWLRHICKILPRNMDHEEITKFMLEAADKFSLCDLAAVHLLISSGIRVQEMCTLKIMDVNLIDRTAMVHRQKSKPRLVLFSEDCSILLTKLIEESQPDQEYVFG